MSALGIPTSSAITMFYKQIVLQRGLLFDVKLPSNSPINMSSVTIRNDEETKTDAAKIVADFGLDLSSVTRALYRQIVREQRIPLNLSYLEPNTESMASIEESDEMLQSGFKSYKNADDMFNAMGM